MAPGGSPPTAESSLRGQKLRQLRDGEWSQRRQHLEHDAGELRPPLVGTHEGVCPFDGEFFVPFALRRVEVKNSESHFSPNVVFDMFEDRACNLSFGTDGQGAHRYDGELASYSMARSVMIHCMSVRKIPFRQGLDGFRFARRLRQAPPSAGW